MKAKLIAINWALSLCGLCVDTERSPLWVVLLMAGWFCGATVLLKYADRRGWMTEV
jgi:hypothetical protein